MKTPSKELLIDVIKNKGCHKLVDRCFDVSSYEMKCSECSVSFYNLGIVNETFYGTNEEQLEKVNKVISYFIERYGPEELFDLLL